MPGKKSGDKTRYSVHPAVAMVQKWVAELKTKTGRSLDEWMELMGKEGPATEQDRRDWLKKRHGLGTNSAWWLAERSVGKGGEEDTPEAYLSAADKYVAEMYAGPKAALRPIYDALLQAGLGTGPEAKACPCRTMVPLYRHHVFAQIKPTTQTRIDLGLCFLKLGKNPPKRFIDTGGAKKGDRITHRVEITSPAQVDAEVKSWLKTAYELDA
ncbi:MAG TPA: DUF5655 domain-containing protein [Patescibacteria group bacterium]|nr:DUF5655 domain-containing protein [Patescibacteria group bacterium]